MIRTKVIFLCTGNSARSQMAEGLLRHAVGSGVEVLSAGLDPKGVSPHAIQAMKDIGIDISGHRAKNVTDFLGQPIQIVVSVCDRAREKCPVFPLAYKYLHWSIPDPAAVEDEATKAAAFSAARDRIKDHIANELLPLLQRTPH